MKIILLACLLAGVYCDQHAVSSYSSLPYETDPAYFQNSVHDYESQNYGYPERGKSKFAFHFGKMVKAPYNIVKGASDYMTNVFSDIKGKLLQLKGSIARSKGNSLVQYGEDMLRKAYNFRGKQKNYATPVHQYVQPYYSYESQNYVEPKPHYGAPGAEFYAGISGGFGTHSGRSFGSPKVSDIVPESEFHPSPYDLQPVENLIALGSQPLPSEELLNNKISTGRSGKGEETKDQAVVASEPRLTVGSISDHEDQRPIPVPVPIAIAPMKLVFPSLPY